MKIKEGVILAGLNLKMRPVLIAANNIWKEAGKELVVTSGLDGAHSAGSKHYYGLALDFRTRYFNEIEKKKVFAALEKALGNSFFCLLHETHIHVQHREYN
jgi:hypothetical protein